MAFFEVKTIDNYFRLRDGLGGITLSIADSNLLVYKLMSLCSLEYQRRKRTASQLKRLIHCGYDKQAHGHVGVHGSNTPHKLFRS